MEEHDGDLFFERRKIENASLTKREPLVGDPSFSIEVTDEEADRLCELGLNVRFLIWTKKHYLNVRVPRDLSPDVVTLEHLGPMDIAVHIRPWQIESKKTGRIHRGVVAYVIAAKPSPKET